MIDEKDLVTGSLVADVLGYPYVVDLLTNGNGICDLEARSISDYPRKRRLFDYTDLRGVPITGEWLARLGYSLHDNGKRHSYSQDSVKSTVIAHYELDHLVFHLVIHVGGLVKLDYVHHLQALIWHLERQWLEVTPNPVKVDA